MFYNITLKTFQLVLQAFSYSPAVHDNDPCRSSWHCTRYLNLMLQTSSLFSPELYISWCFSPAIWNSSYSSAVYGKTHLQPETASHHSPGLQNFIFSSTVLPLSWIVVLSGIWYLWWWRGEGDFGHPETPVYQYPETLALRIQFSKTPVT